MCGWRSLKTPGQERASRAVQRSRPPRRAARPWREGARRPRDILSRDAAVVHAAVVHASAPLLHPALLEKVLKDRLGVVDQQVGLGALLRLARAPFVDAARSPPACCWPCPAGRGRKRACAFDPRAAGPTNTSRLCPQPGLLRGVAVVVHLETPGCGQRLRVLVGPAARCAGVKRARVFANAPFRLTSLDLRGSRPARPRAPR